MEQWVGKSNQLFESYYWDIDFCLRGGVSKSWFSDQAGQGRARQSPRQAGESGGEGLLRCKYAVDTVVHLVTLPWKFSSFDFKDLC